jgi:hypothetical protein
VSQSPRRVFSRQLSQGAHSRRFSVDMDPTSGWTVRDEQDAELIRQTLYDRVELAMSRFALEARQLTRDGWHEA